jgi:hypothetical protein
MLSLRNRFGIPGVISVIALVFAMLGGAYAASSSSGGGKATASAKGKRGPRGPKGATGPAGPVGPAGPAGAKGDNGANGSNGAAGPTGTDGTSVTVTDEAPVIGECGDPGGQKLESASGTDYVCNGEDGEPGSPWPMNGTLPPGATETGAYAIQATKAESSTAGGPEYVNEALSFPVPLSSAQASASTAVFVPPEDTTTEHCSAAPINGTVVDPKAESGYLCVYAATLYGGSVLAITNMAVSVFNKAGPSGAQILFEIIGTEPDPELLRSQGSWAVTG